MESQKPRKSKGNKQKVKGQCQKWWFCAAGIFFGAAVLVWFLNTEREIVVVNPQPSYTIIVAEVTGYTSDPNETDSTPTITANNTVAQEGIVACPRELSFGTIVQISGRDYVCRDRTAIKNNGIFDIFFSTKAEAFEWGRQVKEIIIYEKSF